MTNKTLDNKIIVFDSNVWLDLYKLPPVTIVMIANSIESKIDNFWLPNQVYIEFNRHLKKNRDYAVLRFENLKSNSLSLINDTKNSIHQEFLNLKNNDIFDISELHMQFNSEIEKVSKLLKKGLEKIDEEYKQDVQCILPENDVIQDVVEKLRSRSFGKGFNIKELLAIYEEGEVRFKYNLPPGVTDINKDKHEDTDTYLARKYGDLIIWKEILRMVNEINKDIIFVENEKKADWWESRGSKMMSKILANEFLTSTDKKSIEMYRFEDFLEIYGEELGIPHKSIKEIVNKINYVKSVKKYITENINEFMSDLIQENYLDSGLYEDEMQDWSLFGGTFESSEYAELASLNIVGLDVNFEQEWDDYAIDCDVEMEINLDLTEYVQRHVSHVGSVVVKALLNIETNISIDFTDLSAEVKEAIKGVHTSFNDFQVIDYNYDAFDVSIDFDEDLLRDR